jgi:hypothetical protein
MADEAEASRAAAGADSHAWRRDSEGKSFTCQRERERLVAIGDPPGCLQLVHAQPVLHYSELDVLFVRATVLLTSATPRPSRSCRFLPLHPEREPEYSAEIC